MSETTILLVDDEPAILFSVSEYLAVSGYNVATATCLEEARKAMDEGSFRAVILDLKLPDGNGIDWISELREAYPYMAIIVITGQGNIPVAVEAMRCGADHFLTKPVNLKDIEVFLQKSLEVGILRRSHLTIQRLTKKITPYFGESLQMKRVIEIAKIAAGKDAPVLLLGETGTGKGVLARWIHENSRLSSGPFVEVNCSALSGEMLSSELFGHAKGAFTSAVRDRQGLIEVADGGTLFLDEIGDIAPEVQARIMKVLEEKEYRRLGEVRVRRSAFRLICATNRDLHEATRTGKFRADLYFRINLLAVTIPPLRERLDDFTGMVEYIFHSLGVHDRSVSPETVGMLMNYPWPGNFRELKNVIERALITSTEKVLDIEQFDFLLPFEGDRPTSQGGMMNLDQLEEEHIREAINRLDGDIKKVAETLGISRATLYRRIKKFRTAG